MAGLTTAVVLSEAGASVHVIAEQVPGVTSLAAGAMWGPYLVEPKDKIDQWGQRSLEIFHELAQDPATGVRLTSGIEASRTAEAAPDWATTLPGFRPCERAELPAGFTAGYRFTVPLIDMPTYLDYLLRRLRDAGGVVERRRLTSLSEAGPASAIINCAGLGATPSSWAAPRSTARAIRPPMTRRRPVSSPAVPRPSPDSPRPVSWSTGSALDRPAPRSGWRKRWGRTAPWSCTTTGTGVLASRCRGGPPRRLGFSAAGTRTGRRGSSLRHGPSRRSRGAALSTHVRIKAGDMDAKVALNGGDDEPFPTSG
ncbi:FAD-dependent oxidoreductase [Streptomyces sp. NPDC000134]|uniref:FAD-dependent oxidoreductase n=1 Tax=Streptomyces sp. NPDC000134 TaxID=3364536 RepID=UPI0036A8FA6E